MPRRIPSLIFASGASSGRFFLVRADDRLVEWEGSEQKCSAIRAVLARAQCFRQVRQVEYHGAPAQQHVAEVAVRLLRPGQRNRPGTGDRQKLPGPPLPLRLVLAEVRSDTGQVLATWRLLTNLPAEVDDATVALWYYWRWSIEKYFKLLKSAGMNVEQWQQESAHAIAARLLVASMACVTVWRLARSSHPQAENARRFLVRLSGRQMKRSQPWTMPAMLAGMWTLLAMIDVLDHYSPDELSRFAKSPSSTTTHPKLAHLCRYQWVRRMLLLLTERDGRAPKLQTPIGVESARLGAFSQKVRSLSNRACCLNEASAGCTAVESAFVSNQGASQRGRS